MARRRHYSRNNSGGSYARKHVEEARRFSHEIGGTDEDVKRYFFSLPQKELNPILIEYGHINGEKAEAYARTTFSKWRSGQTRMSGLVARRLFNLLPPRMPLQIKFELAENIWKHFGPSSTTSIRIGPNTPITRVVTLVLLKLDQVVTEYSIPENVKNRFDWIAAGDIGLKENLLNHFRQIEKTLAAQKTENEIPNLQKQVRDHGETTKLAKSVITIHKHQFNLFVLSDLEDQILEGPPPTLSSSSSGFNWWIVIGVVIGLFFIFSWITV